ncbi:cysteine synthase [Clostridia bacterium]|nr:cysteine synthase [Clostridia bacterium]
MGNTPLIELNRIDALPAGVRLFAKAEFFNPSGSVKDRAATAIIADGIASGKLSKDKTIIDATSGNTGIAYAMIGAAYGYPVTLYMPANTSAERKSIMRSFGAKIIETSPLESSDGAFNAVREEVAKNPEKYFYADQYNNPVNPFAHYNGTGLEIWEQTGGKVTHFIAGMGTSGTFVGTSRRLKKENNSIVTVVVQPSSPFHGIEGTKHMETTIKPGILDESLEDSVVEVSTEQAYEMTRKLAKQEGIFVGISSGANVSAALELCHTLPSGSVVVTILCDSGSRYTSDAFWNV